MSSRLLIKGGQVVNHDRSFKADVYCEDGKIKEVGLNLNVPNDAKIIDATDKLVIPGGIDSNTSFEFYTMGTRTVDDFFTGTRAALAGGTTTILNNASENSGSLIESYELNKKRAEKKACCDYAFHVCVKSYDDETVGKEMEKLAKENGVSSFKIQVNELNDANLIKVLNKCKELGVIPIVHPENVDLIDECVKRVKSLGITGAEGHLLSRSEEAETEAVQKVITIANQLNCPIYIMNVMSKSAASAIADAKRKGQVVFGEPITASLGTDGTHYFNQCWVHSANHVVIPPLRNDPSTPSDLMDLLSNNGLDLVGSNHCSFNTSQKALGKDDFTKIPNGVNGVEDRMAIVWDKGVRTGKMDETTFVSVTSTNAAKLFNLYPRKGRIEKDSDADVVVWDPEGSKTISASTHHQASDFNIFEGMVCHGLPSVVVSNGKVVFENGALNVEQGTGKLVQSQPFSDHVYKRVLRRDNSKPKKVEREAYTGAVIDLTKDIEQALGISKVPQPSQAGDFHHRPPTKSGGRNMQDSSFSFGGQQWDDQPVRSSTRVRNPPGGKSSGIF